MSDILETGRKLAEEQFAEGGFTSKLNAYECDGDDFSKQDGCGSFIITIDRHPGVTPFMVKCGNCGQFAHSKMYRVQRSLQPTHEWYRPDTLAGIPASHHDHLSRGGLLLRPIGEDLWQKTASALAYDALMHAKMQAFRNQQDAKIEEMNRSVMSDSALDRSKFPSRQAWRAAKRRQNP